jgi:RND family efflux transporter MFP subunit
MNRRTTVIVCGVVLLAAVGIVTLIFRTEPTAQRSGASRQTAMLVDVVEAERGDFRPEIAAVGTVEPVRDVVLRPQVGGEILERMPAFTPGGFVDRGQVLVRIDPADFRNALDQRRSELRQAEADLELERGRQRVAQHDFELLGEQIGAENADLVLRRPQLATAEARVESARAAVRQAELDLERTTVRAPFDAHILERSVDVGSQVSPGDDLGRLVGLDTYWVVATVPTAMLRWIAVPDGPGEEGAVATIRDRAGWPEGLTRAGTVDAVVGSLEGRTRMARVLITVPDPFARTADDASEPPLMAGAFVDVRITGAEFPDVVRLHRDHVRDGDTVWIMEDGRLRIREVSVVMRDTRWAYVDGGVEAGELVVTTNLATVTDGAALRLEGESAPDAGADDNGPADASEGGA